MHASSVIRSVALRGHALIRGGTVVRSATTAVARRSVFPRTTTAGATSHSSLLLLVRRSFATPATDELADKLGREHDEELENGNNEIPQELAELKTGIEKDWKIVDGTVTKLYRTTTDGDGNFKVQISFHCQDTVPNDSYINDDESGGGMQIKDPMGNDYVPPKGLDPEQQEDEEEQQQQEKPEDVEAVRFTVTATKAGKSLVFSCICKEGATVKIDGVSVSEASPDDIHAGTVDTDTYQGPEYEELADDLKDAFINFCQTDLGINDDMAAFITMYTDYKEQLDYVQFLKDAKNMLTL